MGSYSYTVHGEITTDGRHIDVNGNPVPKGLDEDTKRQLQEQIDGRKVITLPSEADLIAAVEAIKAQTEKKGK